MTSKIKCIAAKTAAKASAFVALALARANYYILCDDTGGSTTTVSGGSGGSAFDDAVNVANNLKSELFTVARALFPLAIVICAVAMFFTRDQKKFDTEKHIMIGCVAAFILLLVVENGHLISTVESLFSGS